MPFEKVNINQRVEHELKDEAFKASYEQIKKEYQLIEQLVNIRKSKKITQVELAKRSHVSQQAISRLENEMHIPKMDTLLRIVEGLGCTLTITDR
jgi:DNA-binding XRE family transcriptional regulator